ncbi:class I SAM-dependent methyltransferase [Microvirga pakistanensis]|uniref:class I SAM-dependent methyltransferase n=1 Tax=Microvirga pakistanensis TaxID=1682650 RepID=UPI00106BB022|nr:class I SAM-dependent methyltransferase [Microvirga pakistanensis]
MANAKHLKPGYRKLQKRHGDTRSPERLVAHYELERQLADRLRRSTRSEREHLYTDVYSELFARLPDHPQNNYVADPQAKRIASKVRLLSAWLKPDDVFLEVGCGDAALSFALADRVAATIGMDVTDALVDFASAPENFRFLKTPGVEIALPDASVDFIYSNQLMEHLHVEDAVDQLREIARVLKPGRRYMCVTPSRVTGPHDISCYFDDVATGFHMREYDYGSMKSLFLKAGFRRVQFMIVVNGRRLATPPYAVLRGLELILASCPNSMRLALNRFTRPLMGITAMGIK